LTLKLPCGDAIIASPVIRELVIVGIRGESKALSKPRRNLRISVDRPQSRKQMNVVHEPRGAHAITDIVRIGLVVLETQILNTLTAAEETPEHAFDRGAPHLTAVAFEHASRDPGKQDDDVGELVCHGQRTP